MAQSTIREKANALIFGLIYPAFLGTYLVTVGTSWKQFAAAGLAGWLGFLLLYFGSQFVESSTNNRDGYSWWQFVVDAVIVALFTAVFVSLSKAAAIAEANHGIASPEVLDYAFLAGTFLLATLSRGSPAPEAPFLDRLAWAGIVAAGLGMLGRALVDRGAPALPMWKALPSVALVTLWLLLSIYLCTIVVRALVDKGKAKWAWDFLKHGWWKSKRAWLLSLLPAGVVLVLRALRAVL
jgi:hypothetical protein